MLIIRTGNPSTLAESFRVRLSDWGLAVIALLFGLVLLHPAETFAAPVYGLMARTAPEAAWGGFALILGGGRIGALFINGRLRRSPHLLVATALLTGFLWVQVALSLFSAGGLSTGLAVYPVLAVMELFSAYRAAMDARLSDDAANGARKNDRP